MQCACTVSKWDVAVPGETPGADGFPRADDRQLAANAGERDREPLQGSQIVEQERLLEHQVIHDHVIAFTGKGRDGPAHAPQDPSADVAEAHFRHPLAIAFDGHHIQSARPGVAAGSVQPPETAGHAVPELVERNVLIGSG